MINGTCLCVCEYASESWKWYGYAFAFMEYDYTIIFGFFTATLTNISHTITKTDQIKCENENDISRQAGLDFIDVYLF